MTEQKIHPDLGASNRSPLGEKKRLLEQYVHVHGLSVEKALELLGLTVIDIQAMVPYPKPWKPEPLYNLLADGDDL